MPPPGNDSPSWAQLALRLGFFSLRHRPWRRKLMFYLAMGSLAQLALGVLLLAHLSKSALVFLLYWGFNGLMVCLMLLLAVYDVLALRQEQRLELRRLREGMYAEQQDASSDDDDPGNSGAA